MKKITTTLLLILTMILTANATSSKKYIDDTTIQKTRTEIAKHSSFSQKLIERGVEQVAAFWTAQDGTTQDFIDFCVANYCKDLNAKNELFERIATNFETILGHNNRVTVELLRPLHVTGYKVLPVDEIFGAYNGLSHFNDDMFDNKLAFIVILNYPSFTLEEKVSNGETWSPQEWGYVRLGDLFTSRVPAKIQQNINNATAAADHYISNYNIYMGKVWSNNNVKYWPDQMKLITHWGLRDELKSCYADQVNGLEKQQIVYNIMKRIVDQTIPEDVINKDEYIWYPSTNQIFIDRVEIGGRTEPNTRYQHMLDIYKAMQESDRYYETYPTYMSRKFDGEFEVSMQETERLFTQLLSSPQVKEVADLIAKRLGRKLQPFDIWYDGFNSRGAITPVERVQRTSLFAVMFV
ncbi:MAG: hypothetical protein RR356_07250 [Bacteroidales bacterium]